MCKKNFFLSWHDGTVCAEVTCSRKKNLSIVKQNAAPAPTVIVLKDTPSATLASTTHQSPGPSWHTETSAMPKYVLHFIALKVLF